MPLRPRPPAPSGVLVDYESEDFPAGSLSQSTGPLHATWDEILWAAVTVGRPNRHYVFQHGLASRYEALFRLSLVRMALHQRGAYGRKLCQTSVFKTLDPTEKGAVTYFLGLVFCKLFAAKLLDAPWLLHLDVFRNQLDARVLRGRSRPDLIGQSAGREWFAFECKGRSSAPTAAEKTRAKAQAQRVVSVDGTDCALHVGAISYLRGEILRFYWRDPEPAEPRKLNSIEIASTDEAWGDYYAPFAALLRDGGFTVSPSVRDGRLLAVEGADIEIGAHPKITRPLLEGEWKVAREVAMSLSKHFVEEGYQADGLMVRSGPSWKERYDK